MFHKLLKTKFQYLILKKNITRFKKYIIALIRKNYFVFGRICKREFDYITICKKKKIIK